MGLTQLWYMPVITFVIGILPTVDAKNSCWTDELGTALRAAMRSRSLIDLWI